MASFTGDSKLDEKISQWVKWNKNEMFQKELDKIIEAKDVVTLKKLFLKRLEFGTAGLRGRMGPGYSQMNDLVIIQTAQGLLKYLIKNQSDFTEKGIVIGYDGRYNSKRFANLTATVFLNYGAPVYLFSKVCPTPFVPFSITKFHTAAGVMVTASHNPKDDNGYKVYWSNGAQIITPHDKGIASSIEENLEPDNASWDTSVMDNCDKLIDPLNDIMKDYYDKMKSNLINSSLNNVAPFRITYTAMHGVGYPYIVEAFKQANFKDVIPVKEQVEPDPEFSTVEFPNPEEGKSSLKLAMSTADANDSKLILANDPDADRLAVAEKLSDGTWKVFTGNEIGAMLGWWLMYTYKIGRPHFNYRNVYTLSSTVSSKIVKTIALAEGFSFEETLTGFKWMGNRSYDLMKKGKLVLFAFEEAIGFMCGSSVLDKDGISAAVHVAELAAYLYTKNSTLNAQLEEIYSRYGYHISDDSYFHCYEPDVLKSIFDSLRNYKGEKSRYPESLLDGKYKIVSIRDLTTGYDSSQPDKRAKLPVSSSTQMITFNFDNGLVLTLRTSGTEPKLKYYAELCASSTIQDKDALKSTLKEMVNCVIKEFLQPDKNNLKYKTT